MGNWKIYEHIMPGQNRFFSCGYLCVAMSFFLLTPCSIHIATGIGPTEGPQEWLGKKDAASKMLLFASHFRYETRSNPGNCTFMISNDHLFAILYISISEYAQICWYDDIVIYSDTVNRSRLVWQAPATPVADLRCQVCARPDGHDTRCLPTAGEHARKLQGVEGGKARTNIGSSQDQWMYVCIYIY